MFTISKMIKVIITLSVLLISSGANGSTTEEPDVRTFNGWMIEKRSQGISVLCYVLFPGPRVSPTSLLCVKGIAANDESLFVIKTKRNPWRSVRDILVDVRDFFGLGLKKNFTTINRMFAILRSQKPVIPGWEINQITYGITAKDINEVNLKECSLQIENYSGAYFADCNVKNADSLENTDDIIECTGGSLETMRGIIGLFCPLNEDVGTKVLVGVAFDGGVRILESELK